jgi:hypothetical protein
LLSLALWWWYGFECHTLLLLSFFLSFFSFFYSFSSSSLYVCHTHFKTKWNA